MTPCVFKHVQQLEFTTELFELSSCTMKPQDTWFLASILLTIFETFVTRLEERYIMTKLKN